MICRNLGQSVEIWHVQVRQIGGVRILARPTCYGLFSSSICSEGLTPRTVNMVGEIPRLMLDSNRSKQTSIAEMEVKNNWKHMRDGCN